MAFEITRRSFIKSSTVAAGALALSQFGISEENAGSLAIKAAHSLVERVLPSHAQRFVCELIPAERNLDVFEYDVLSSKKIALRGNNGVALAVAFNQYLRREAGVSYDWQAVKPLTFIRGLPMPKQKVRRLCLAQERFFLNYCTYGYTFPYWGWAKWQRFLDWMAMNGINRPLLQAGQEAVWLRVWQSYGMTAEQVRTYFSGPAHLPWHRMANLDRYGGPLPMSYIEGQRRLQQKILARARELGMKPILSGFAGHVPAELARLRPQAKITRIKPGWGGMTAEYATSYLDPTDQFFAEIQKKFLYEQTALYGTNHLYAADPFNEMQPPSWEPSYLASVSKAIFEGMTAADPKARWYQMAWTFNYDKRWTEERLAALFEPVPHDLMVLLDYACEEAEVYRRTKNFYGHQFIWNYLGNFGGRTHLLAPLDTTSQHIKEGLKVPNCLGVGSTLEGVNVNPVIYEMVFEQPWHPGGSIDLSSWIKDYAVRRGGRAEHAVIEAWQALAATVLNEKSVNRDNGSIFQVYPSFKGRDGWTRPNIAYAPDDLVQALGRMLQAADACRTSDSYCFDVVNLTRQVLGNHGLDIYRRMLAAYTQKDLAEFKREASTFLELGRDLDELLGTRHEFLLGPWLGQARRWGKTPAEADYYEGNAREIITCWHQSSNGLRDYASRQWNGLLRTYYLPRWEKFIEMAMQSLIDGTAFNEKEFTNWTSQRSMAWIKHRSGFSETVTNDGVETAERLFKKYSEQLNGAGVRSVVVVPRISIQALRTKFDVAATDFDHAEWARCQSVPITRYWSGADAPAGRHAEARLLWSDQALHLRFVCRQTEPLVSSPNPQTAKKTIGLWDRDVCEIFIAPDPAAPERYVEFEAAPTGEWLDVAIHWTPDKRESDWEFHSGMTSGARVENDRVVIGMRLPWGDWTHKPQAGERWRVNLFRCVGAGEKRGYLTWQPTRTAKPNFHLPQAFGWLEFT